MPEVRRAGANGGHGRSVATARTAGYCLRGNSWTANRWTCPDPDNRLTPGYPSGREATASFDSLERIATLTEGGQSVASLAYAGRGRMASVTLGGSLAKQTWAYNGDTAVANAAGDFGAGLPTAAGLRGTSRA
jgi:hypothetical protein